MKCFPVAMNKFNSFPNFPHLCRFLFILSPFSLPFTSFFSFSSPSFSFSWKNDLNKFPTPPGGRTTLQYTPLCVFMTFFPVFLLFCYPFFPKINLPKRPLKKTSLFCFLLLFAIQSFPPPIESNFTGPVKFCSVCNLKRCVFCRFSLFFRFSVPLFFPS